MNVSDFYCIIEEIKKQLESRGKLQLSQELQYFIESNLWRSPLIYTGLYIGQIGSPSVLTFFAEKTLDAIEKVCEQNIKDKTGTLNSEVIKRKEEEPRISKKQMEQLLVAITISVSSFNSPDQSKVIDNIGTAIIKKLGNIKKQIIDKLSTDYYLNLLKHRFKQNENKLQSIMTFFEDLIINAGWDESKSLERNPGTFKKYIELLIEETGKRLEKPDRLFTYADSLETVTNFAESLFDSEELKGKLSFDKSKWDFQHKNYLDNLRLFWTTCMTGLFALSQSIDRYIAISQKGKKPHKDAPSTQMSIEETPITETEKISPEVEKKPSKSLFGIFRNKPSFRLAFEF